MCKNGSRLAIEVHADAASMRRAAAQRAIGFIGLGRMGTAMAANLVAAGCRVIAYVRRAEQMGELVTLGLEPRRDRLRRLRLDLETG